MYYNSYCIKLITCGNRTNNPCHDVNATPKTKPAAAKITKWDTFKNFLFTSETQELVSINQRICTIHIIYWCCCE